MTPHEAPPRARWLPLALILGACPGIFAWELYDQRSLARFSAFSPTAAEIGALLGFMGASILLVGGVALGVGQWRRRKQGDAIGGVLPALNRWFLPLLALPAIPILTLPKIETRWPGVVLLLAGWMGIVAIRWTYGLPQGLQGRGRPWAPVAAVLALVATYAVSFSILAVIRHHSLITGIKDLGIYDSIFWHTVRGDLLGANFVKSGNHAAAHVDPILIGLSPLYWIYPHAETLLVLQSVWLASGAIPLFLLARTRLGAPWQAVALSAVYLLYPALHGTNLFDFHSLALIVPLLFWAVYCLETRRIGRYAVVLALLLLCREDVSLLCCGLGLWIIASGRGLRVGLATIAVSACYLAFVKLEIMPDPNLLMSASPKTYSYASFYSDLIPNGRGGVGTLIKTVFLHPQIPIRVIFTHVKLLFFLNLFLPLLFVPLFGARRGWVALAYGFAFLFLASRTEVFSLYFQYPVVLYPLAMALVPQGLVEISQGRVARALRLDAARVQRALVFGMLTVTVALSTRFGALLPNRAFRPGKQAFYWEMTHQAWVHYAWVKQAVASIPPDASVAATFRLGPHISNREEANDFEDDYNADFHSDYLLMDTFKLADRTQKDYDRIVKSHAFTQISKEDTLELWKRVLPARKAAR